MFPVDNLHTFLRGAWRVERDYSDRRTGKRGHFVGSAEFTDDPDTTGLLRYRESIETELDDYSGTSHQEYRYRFDSDASAQVSFRDGRPFHSLDLSTGLCRVSHICDPDDYAGIFRAVTADDWRLRWKVTGPRKHYVIESRFTRKRRQ